MPATLTRLNSKFIEATKIIGCEYLKPVSIIERYSTSKKKSFSKTSSNNGFHKMHKLLKRNGLVQLRL